jgi:periplasmic protein TonB
MQTAFTLDEIVFEGRNRAYGAYALRQPYRPTLTRAIGIGVGVFLLAVSAPTLYARLTDRSNQAIMTEVTLTKVKMVEPLEKRNRLNRRKSSYQLQKPSEVWFLRCAPTTR